LVLEKRRRHEREIGRRAKTVRQAAPRPVLRATDEASFERVPLDVPAHAHEHAGFLDGEGLEATLVDGSLTDALAVAVPPPRVGSAYPVHQPRQPVRVDWTHDEVEVVRQHAVGDEPRGMAAEALIERGQKGPIIGGALKERRLSHAAIDDVKEPRCRRVARSSWHSRVSLGRGVARSVPDRDV
jgi:hypothetical protein